MELLKQPLCHPLSMPEQVITLVAATHKVFLDVEISKIKSFQMGMLEWMSGNRADLINEIAEKKALTDELIEEIVKAAKEYKENN